MLIQKDLLFKMVKVKLFILLSFVLCCECSVKIDVSRKRSQTRVAGANVAEPTTRPFQAALYINWDTNHIGFCGGALISPNVVLTAAHCVGRGDYQGTVDSDLVDESQEVVTDVRTNEQAVNVQIILGAYSLYDRYEADRRVYAASEIIIHPEYSTETYENDIAIVKISRDVELSDAINIIGLPWVNNTGFNFAGRASVVSGWGIPAPGVPYIAPMLREKSLTVMSDSLCNSFYFNFLPSSIICAFEANSGTCKGDDGSPLTLTRTIGDEESEPFLVGIASFMHSSGCNIDIPSVFTRVQNYLDWIQDNTDIALV